MLEPFILISSKKRKSTRHDDQQFLTKIFNELKQTYTLDKVIDKYLIDFTIESMVEIDGESGLSKTLFTA